jgi:sialate O-acetylesterase
MKKYLFLFISFTAFSNIKLPSLVSDGMVLQRDVPVHIWGWANPGEKVNILFKGKKIKTLTGPQGHWFSTLPATPAGGPYEYRLTKFM